MGSSRSPPTSLIVLTVLVLRLVNSLLIRTFFNPDEYWQGPEVAYRLTFGRGYLTWEWREGLRSYLQPLLFAILFKCLQIGGMDSRWAVAYGPSLVQALFAAICDLYTYKLVRRVWGPEVAWWALASQLCCWFNAYCMTRTFSSSLEATLVTVALYHWVRVWEYRQVAKQSTLPPRLVSGHEAASLAVGSLAVFIRPPGAILWVPLGLWRLWHTSGPLRYLVSCVLPMCGSVFTLGVLVDRWGYGAWVFSPYHFFRFNILESKASLYGTHPWHWYFTQGLPAVLGPLLPLTLMGSRQNDQPLVTTTALLVTWCIAGLSLSAHKEFRFLLPILPLCTGLAGLGAHRLYNHYQGKGPRLLVQALLLINLPVAWYLGRYHQRGPIEVMDYLAARLAHMATPPSTSHSAVTVDFLTPCHATPFYSYLHLPPPRPGDHPPLHLDLRMLDCSPEARLSPQGSETDRFLASPQEFVSQRYGSSGGDGGLPHYLVLFSSAARQLGPQLASWGYDLSASFFYSSFKTDMDALHQEDSLLVYEHHREGRRRREDQESYDRSKITR